MVSARLIAAAVALASVTLAVGCEEPPDPWDSLRVVIDTDATVPDELDAFTITVEREGVALFDES